MRPVALWLVSKSRRRCCLACIDDRDRSGASLDSIIAVFRPSPATTQISIIVENRLQSFAVIGHGDLVGKLSPGRLQATEQRRVSDEAGQMIGKARCLREVAIKCGITHLLTEFGKFGVDDWAAKRDCLEWGKVGRPGLS